MAEDSNRSGYEKTPVGADLVIPIAAVVFTIYYFSTIIDSPWTAQVTGFFVGTILIALCVVFFARVISDLARGSVDLGFRKLIEPISILPKRFGLAALTLGYIIVIPWLGFTLTSLIFLSAGMLLLSGGRNVVSTISLAAGLAVVWFVVFVLIFQRQFPLGWLDEQIKSLLEPALQMIGLG